MWWWASARNGYTAQPGTVMSRETDNAFATGIQACANKASLSYITRRLSFVFSTTLCPPSSRLRERGRVFLFTTSESGLQASLSLATLALFQGHDGFLDSSESHIPRNKISFTLPSPCSFDMQVSRPMLLRAKLSSSTTALLASCSIDPDFLKDRLE